MSGNPSSDDDTTTDAAKDRGMSQLVLGTTIASGDKDKGHQASLGLSSRRDKPTVGTTIDWRRGSTVRFNVCGKVYDVSKWLLEQYPDTMLAQMAEDTWRPTKKIKTGRKQDNNDCSGIFIDGNGDRFQYVLDYMRDRGTLSLPASVSKNALIQDLTHCGFEDVDASQIATEGSRNLRTITRSPGYERHFWKGTGNKIFQVYEEKDYDTVRDIWEMIAAYGSARSNDSSLDQSKHLPLHCETTDDAVFQSTHTTADGRIKMLKFVTLLKRVYLCWLPCSVCKLTELKILNLRDTPIQSLPNAIGDLTGLERLDLSSTSLRTLPGSIGKLDNLLQLLLGGTKKLQKLPNEIGQLTRLETLNLSRSSVQSLPNSIVNLKNLELLDLAESNVNALPHSMGSMVGLKCLFIGEAAVLRNSLDRRLFLRSLVERCPSLGQLDSSLVDKEDDQVLHYALAQNRAKCRWFPILGQHKSSDEAARRKLWPRMLANARHLFDWDIRHQEIDYQENENEHQENDYNLDRFSTPDGAYWLLQNGTHFFVEALSGRDGGGGPNYSREKH